MSIARDYTRLAIVERIIGKAAGVSEVTQIARGEKRTRSFLLAAWNKRLKQAVDTAVKSAKKLKNAKTISKEIDQIMELGKFDVLKIFATEFSNTYRLGRNVGFKKATKQTNASLLYGLPKESSVKKSKKIKHKTNTFIIKFL